MHSNTRQAVRVDAFGLREMALGKSRQAHQRTIMHSNTRQALNASTRSVYAKWYWVNHGRLTSEQSCTRTLDRQRTIMHSIEHSTGSERVDAFGLREMVLGKSRQAHQRTAGSPANANKAYLPLPIVTHQSLDPAARALKRQASWQALNASTRSVNAKWYWVNHGRLTSERQAHQRMQSLPSATHRHSSITRPCCSSAQAPSFLSFTRRRVRDSPSR